ncbi:ubiquitin carboxyl-terminal hydrolase 36-like isoform X2 [Neodiprion fabricii]|nr:ubiquitin carboxyl-terminal hydrolase 36-like isoform X2 [Neodiprion fabricii]XP_046422926.1 ubiquitin carboxyl-terminal hydrolase 36-like isoform X2 [Neodiprion fabricii]XP_046422927.1 ubiquitin carboxyl-terminal hydrolase 36-like isoform X2 [Neodiprion fabricii]XP_046422928.1 ubiquitin carboxyl-terminal hydrolase 36-like isoform X2 [Neodiprion fabricii]
MAYNRGGHAGAVAVSYSTNAMPTPLSPRRYSSGSGLSTTTSGVGSSVSSKLASSYRTSGSTSSFDRSTNYYSSGSGYGSTHRSSSYSSCDYRRLCSPARSLSVSSASYSDTGSGGGGCGPGSGVLSGAGRYSSSSSSSRDQRNSEARETLGSLAASTADLIAKYSPANYVPNISGSNERHGIGKATVNGYGTAGSLGTSPGVHSSSSSSIVGGNASSAKNHLFTGNESTTSNTLLQGRPPRALRRSPIGSNLIGSNHAQPDSAATEVTGTSQKGPKNDDNNNNSNSNNNNEYEYEHEYGNCTEGLQSRAARLQPPALVNINTTRCYEANGAATCPSRIPESNGLQKTNSRPSNSCLADDGVDADADDDGVNVNSVCIYGPVTNTSNNSLTNTLLTNNNNADRNADDENAAGTCRVHGAEDDEGLLGGRNSTATNRLNGFLTPEDPSSDTELGIISGGGLIDESSGDNAASLLDTISNDPVNAFNSAVRKPVVSRPSGVNHAGDNTSSLSSLPSTSRRGDTYPGNGSTSNAANGIAGNNSQTATAATHQNIYRGINDQIEGSPTIRAPRNRLQTPRDERCGLNGLRNIGNTCFMNSVIQCLSNTRPLLEYLVNEQYLADINTSTSGMKGALIKAFSQVIQELWEVGGEHVVNTTSLKSQIQRFAPRFMGYSQQDAQEFLRYLLEGLHEDVNRVTVKPQPIHTDIPEHYTDSQKAAESWKRYLRNEDSTIVDVFVGQLRSSLHCTSCGHVSVTLDPFWDLSLPIPTRSGTVKLNQCLEHFTKEEVLDGDEKPTCSKCQMRRKCTKSFSIQKFPKILVIHLKRFSPMERFRGKLNVLVDFPLTGLDLSAFSAPRVAGCTYNLYGVANHSGTTYSGHYTAYCKHPYSGEWHEYNDSRVSSIAARSVVSSEGYVLFYEQQPHSSNL